MKIIKYIPSISKQKDASVKNQIIDEVNAIIYKDKKNKSNLEVLVNVSYAANENTFSNLGINLFWTKAYGFLWVADSKKRYSENRDVQHLESFSYDWGKSVKNKTPLFEKKDAAQVVYDSIIRFIEGHTLNGKSEVHISIAQAEIEID
jgi:hypothetical protein